mmetsp:Transcript_110387/g.225741  ORF Transcript_110387/g.225741 Transcript_110387/m.225741 type:complete len:392 (-) Transcript_110387:151-1326(-)
MQRRQLCLSMPSRCRHPYYRSSQATGVYDDAADHEKTAWRSCNTTGTRAARQHKSLAQRRKCGDDGRCPWRPPMPFPSVLLRHVNCQLDEAVAITPLVVIPRHQFYEVIVQCNASPDVKDRRQLASGEVRRHHLVFGHAQDALHGAGRSLLDRGHNVGVLGALLQAASEVHNGHIRRGDPEGHAGQLAVEMGEDLANSLGSASRGGDDVLRGAAAPAPVLAAAGGSIDCQLRGSHSVHRGHETLHDAELLVDHLREGREAICRARGVRDNGVSGLVVGVVDSDDIDGYSVLGRSGDDHLLAAALEVQLRLLLRCENARGLANVGRPNRAPRNAGRILLVEDLDFVPVDYEELLPVRLQHIQGARELLVDAIVLQLVQHVLEVHERVVNRRD